MIFQDFQLESPVKKQPKKLNGKKVGENAVGMVPLFCVEYEGIYLEHLDELKDFRYVIQPRAVKRSFKEFLNLQTRLEMNKTTKKEIMDIRSPNQWLNLPFRCVKCKYAF